MQGLREAQRHCVPVTLFCARYSIGSLPLHFRFFFTAVCQVTGFFSFVKFQICSPLVLPFRRQAMIDEFDLDQDGEINEQEFFAIMTDDA